MPRRSSAVTAESWKAAVVARTSRSVTDPIETVRARVAQRQTRAGHEAHLASLPHYNPAWNDEKNEAWQAWQDAAKTNRPEADSLRQKFESLFA